MKNPLLVVPLVLLLCFTFGCQNKAEKAELEKLNAQADVEAQNKEIVREFFAAIDARNFDNKMIKQIMRIFPDSFQDILLERLLEKSFFSKRGKSGVTESVGTELVLKNLTYKGIFPKVIIDCGAFEGDWTRMAKKIFPRSMVVMIEANPEKEKYLQNIKSESPQTTDYVIALLGAETRQKVKFYQMESGSSVFEEQSNIPRRILYLPMRKLDEVVGAKNLSSPVFVKLDVQGFEVEILKGASEILKKTELVLLEASFLEYNKGAPLVNEVINFMVEHGFVIYDIGSLIRWASDNALMQADLFFIKKDSALRPKYFNFK